MSVVPTPARDHRPLGGVPLDALTDALVGALGPAVRLDAPLGALTTYRVGGRAAALVEVTSEEELLELRAVLDRTGAARRVPVLVLGKGSNLLVADAGFSGLVVRLSGDLGAIDLPAEHGQVVRAGGAADLPVLARRTAAAGLGGLEWAVGIPGSVGGALKMNAGGHGADTASCLLRYRWVDLSGEGDGDAPAAHLRLGYRSSALADSAVVVWAEFAVRRSDPEVAKALISEIVRWRREHQPGGSNAGSVFTNPPGDSAGRLVDEAGLRGWRLGTARVAEKHANFIQADDGGSAADVVALMAHVRRVVAERSGVVLRPEVRLVGFGERPLDAASEGPR